MRLDDACEKRNVEKWGYMEKLLDEYGIKPLVGIIPYCEDPMMDQYPHDLEFWKRVQNWKSKGWVIAMHGYNHVYSKREGGINPVNLRSEFAGEELTIQRKKIRYGYEIFKQNNIKPEVFFAPSHTFDENTIKALKLETEIRIISDTIANSPYNKYGITFVPQQSGQVRKLPFKMVTFCYHPNSMNNNDFKKLEKFLKKNKNLFIEFPLELTKRKMNLWDIFLKKLYFLRRKEKL